MFPAELMVSEIRHGDERLFIGFVRDLSERRRFEARLNRLHANRLDSMADMATALAHELNQPLAAAANYLFTARHLLGAKPEPADAAVDEALDKASSQMHRAGQIIAHLREFIARGEPDKMEQSLHELIRRTCELVAPSAQAGRGRDRPPSRRGRGQGARRPGSDRAGDGQPDPQRDRGDERRRRNAS